MRLYSQTTGCCYLPEIHLEIPLDAKELSEERYQAVIANPERGKARSHDSEGLPILIDLADVVLSPEEQAARERAWRDAQVSETEWLVNRHRDELDLSQTTTLSVELYGELLDYRQSLRDWPQSMEFPNPEYRPTAPVWLAEQSR